MGGWNRRFTLEEARQIRKEFLSESTTSLSRRYSTNPSTIWRIIHNENYHDPDYQPPVALIEERRGTPKLTEEQVKEIKKHLRAKTRLQKELAKEYGVSITTISSIHRGKLYKGVTVLESPI